MVRECGLNAILYPYKPQILLTPYQTTCRGENGLKGSEMSPSGRSMVYMVEDTYSATWLKTEDFNGNKQIIALVEDATIELSNKGKKETVFELLLPNGEYRKLSIWGSNKLNVAKVVGNGKTYDTDAIKGRSVMITVEKYTTKEGTDSYKKVLHVVPK